MSRASDFSLDAARTEYSEAIRAHARAIDRYEQAAREGNDIARASAGRELDRVSRYTLTLREKLLRGGVIK